MGELRPWHIAVLVVLMILLFGAKRLPDAARALGRSMRILKAETRGLADDDAQASAKTPPVVAEVRPAPSPIDAGTPVAPASGAGQAQPVRDNT